MYLKFQLTQESAEFAEYSFENNEVKGKLNIGKVSKSIVVLESTGENSDFYSRKAIGIAYQFLEKGEYPTSKFWACG